MPWFKVDDTLAFHAKVVAAGNAAMGLWVRAGSWCALQLTDGHVPDHMLAALGKKAEANRLVAAGLWSRAEDGYQFHQWVDRQPSKQSVEQRRDTWRERQQRARDRALSRRDASVTDEEPPEDEEETSRRDASVSHRPVTESRPVPSRPVPKVPSEPTPPASPGPPDGDPAASTSTGPSSKPRADRGTRLPEPFEVTDELRAWAAEKAPNAGMADHEAFVDYFRSVPGVKGRKVDWPATWRGWMRRASEGRDGGSSSSRRPGPGPGPRPGPDQRAADVAELAAHLQAQHDARQQPQIGA